MSRIINLFDEMPWYMGLVGRAPAGSGGSWTCAPIPLNVLMRWGIKARNYFKYRCV